MEDNETRDKKTGYAYLDLLATTLTEHEKTLDSLIERLEKISKNLAGLGQTVRLEEQAEPELGAVGTGELETLTYIKIKLGRSTRELKEILETLKE